MKDLKEIGFYTLSDDRVKNTSEFSQMKRCELIIIENCNFRCSYCRGLRNDIFGNRKIRQMSFSEIKRIIDLWCENIPLENIRFSGGEPTIHKDIVKIISYVKKKGIKRIAISTNGSGDLNLYKKLIDMGVNDFSISLDACCAGTGDKIAGGIKGSWEKVVKNIEELSKLTYVTVGIVLIKENILRTIEIINFASKLGVSDIRIIPAAQYDGVINDFLEIDKSIIEKYPILKYRIKNFRSGVKVRGLEKSDFSKCPLVLDDSIVAGKYHFPCIIYMREQGNPIGLVSKNMRRERMEWFENHNSFNDPICKKMCLDVCRDYNNKYRELHNYKKYLIIKEK